MIKKPFSSAGEEITMGIIKLPAVYTFLHLRQVAAFLSPLSPYFFSAVSSISPTKTTFHWSPNSSMDIYHHRLNMELDLQSLFWLLFTAVIIG
jgi:hypothetical protein